MANLNAPSGFKPKRHLSGAPWNGMTQYFLIPSSDATAVFVGDLVKGAGTSGTAGTFVNGVNCEGLPAAILASAGSTGQDLLGAVTGFLPDQNNLMTKHRVASTNRIAMVCTDPTVVYEAQADEVGSALAATDVQANVAYINAAGSTTTGISAQMVDSSTVATTNTLPLKIVGFVIRPDNAINTGGAGTDQAKVEVILNTGLYMPNVAGL